LLVVIPGKAQAGSIITVTFGRKSAIMSKALIPVLLFLTLTIAGCSKKSEDHAHHHEEEAAVSVDPNKALNDSVMDLHNVGMKKMDEMFKLTESLKDKIAKTPSLPSTKKHEIEAAIDSLDHASEGMMVWMRQFNPGTDTADSEAARAYLNQEKVKVTKVTADILSAIEKAKALQQ
jgi:hypothetical protein